MKRQGFVAPIGGRVGGYCTGQQPTPVQLPPVPVRRYHINLASRAARRVHGTVSIVTLINKTLWRTDHLRAIIAIALRDAEVPEVRAGRLIVWVLHGRPGTNRSWGDAKLNQIVIKILRPRAGQLTARKVGRLALDAAAELLGQSPCNFTAWRMETLPLWHRGPTPPTKDQAAMTRFRRAAATAKTWKRKLRLATTMYRKWTLRAARMHRALNQGMAGRAKS